MGQLASTFAKAAADKQLIAKLLLYKSRPTKPWRSRANKKYAEGLERALLRSSTSSELRKGKEPLRQLANNYN